MTTTTLQKWGNSHAIRLPKTFLEECKCAPGTTFRAKKVGKNILLTPVKVKGKAEPVEKLMTKEEFLAGITKKNRHTLWNWGPPVGKEIW